MGQQASREHAPLTFGYVNQQKLNDDEDDNNDMNNDELDHEAQKDFVLANPHLYQLQTICDQCQKLSNTSSSLPTTEVVVSLVGESCTKCKKQKRLSLVRKDLAEDLEYIDQTYYPDLVHYNTTYNNSEQEDPMEQELLEFEKDVDTSQQWSRLTIGEATTTSSGTKRRPRRLTGPSMAVDLSHRSLVKLSPSIGYLDSLTKLNLSNNQMTSLPREIGYLKNLRVLNISNNSIDEIPDTVAFLNKLKAFNVAYNKLVQLPPSIGQLPKLVIIIANDNRLTSLPREFAHLVNLVSLNVSNNPLKSLPAEIGTLSTLRKLLTDNCPFEEEYNYDLRHDPPSLFETCARIAVRSEINIPNQFADHIKEYLSRADTCSYCNGPFFDSFVTRVRFIERRIRQPMALEYTLCSAHWSDENDRLLAMFSKQSKMACSSTRRNVDVDGLHDNTAPNRLRHRAYSDSSYSLHRTVSSSTPVISSPLSRRSNSNVSDNLPTPSSIPISLLKSQPNLPALPQEELTPASYSSSSSASSPSLPPSSSSLLAPANIKGNRPRASSAASVTKRLTSFIRSNSSTSITRVRSPSSSSLTTRTRSSSNSSLTSPSSPLYNNHLQHDQQPANANNTIPSNITVTPPQPQHPSQSGLRGWTDSIQLASAAAAETIATQQSQIEDYFVSRNHHLTTKNNNHPTMHRTELLSSET
ncbi:MAG: hypothetical protein EXX96DRAFT_528947 [Benjaminiella poitrasii]|nr:MAG: hypothetical protein EXX96DRAFT_528947 [Benjaminiella poitrasii]